MGMPATTRSLVLAAERRFVAAGLEFGHGTDNARDEAVFLVFHALGLPFATAEARLDEPVDAGLLAEVERLVAARIGERRPAAYLARRMWFAGLEFQVDERVLIPRSPIAELIAEGFQPWIVPDRIARILDVGTGSGCIAIAAARKFPTALVDATDISADALEVARANVLRYQLERRVALHCADLFPPAAPAYDLILANPPYVPQAEFDELPPEYRHEPPGALLAGADGLDVIRRILAAARSHLSPHGVLVLDTGATGPAVAAAFPALPFIWVDCVHGGDGVCVISRDELPGPGNSTAC